MDLKEIKDIIDLMKKSELTEFAIEEEGFKLHLKRGSGQVSIQSAPPVYSAPPPAAPSPPVAERAASVSSAGPAPADEPGVSYIRSPMVGTFYRSPSPESPPFVDARETVTPDKVVCIIEAMKVMNEIQSEVTGLVTEVLVENGESVEFNQPLFKVKTG